LPSVPLAATDVAAKPVRLELAASVLNGLPIAIVDLAARDTCAWISGWMSVDACGPTMCAPSSSPVAGDTSTLAKLVVSSMAQP